MSGFRKDRKGEETAWDNIYLKWIKSIVRKKNRRRVQNRICSLSNYAFLEMVHPGITIIFFGH